MAVRGGLLRLLQGVCSACCKVFAAPAARCLQRLLQGACSACYKVLGQASTRPFIRPEGASLRLVRGLLVGLSIRLRIL
jgi:hypothetical protein